MYRVIKFFTDLQDKNHPYDVGEEFPRDGIEVSERRLIELSGEHNKQGEPLIEFVADKDEEEDPGAEVPGKEKPAENEVKIEPEEKAEPEPEKETNPSKRSTRKAAEK